MCVLGHSAGFPHSQVLAAAAACCTATLRLCVRHLGTWGAAAAAPRQHPPDQLHHQRQTSAAAAALSFTSTTTTTSGTVTSSSTISTSAHTTATSSSSSSAGLAHRPPRPSPIPQQLAYQQLTTTIQDPAAGLLSCQRPTLISAPTITRSHSTTITGSSTTTTASPGVARRPHRPAPVLQRLKDLESSSYVEDLVSGVLSCQRPALSRAMTLCESTHPGHAVLACELLRRLLEATAARQQQRQQHHQRQQQEVGGEGATSTTAAAGSSSSSSSSCEAGGGPGALPTAATAGFGTSGTSSSSSSLAMASPGGTAVAGGTGVGGGGVAVQGGSSGVPAAVGAAAPLTTSSSSSSSSQLPASLRVGISGPPGVGKSSLIETLGCYLADHGSRVAVLAIDPSSATSGGAILGDKTRMARLASHPAAYVRPSPARGTLGGVARATHDAILIAEAAGYDTVLVETVGVGQSEVTVASLVDALLLVLPPVGGDDLQHTKRGIMEVADLVLVNKADGATEGAAGRTAAEVAACLHMLPRRYTSWSPQVIPVSAHSGRGVQALAAALGGFAAAVGGGGELLERRRAAARGITWLHMQEALAAALRADPGTAWLLQRLLPEVEAGRMAPRAAADLAVAYFLEH